MTLNYRSDAAVKSDDFLPLHRANKSSPVRLRILGTRNRSYYFIVSRSNAQRVAFQGNVGKLRQFSHRIFSWIVQAWCSFQYQVIHAPNFGIAEKTLPGSYSSRFDARWRTRVGRTWAGRRSEIARGQRIPKHIAPKLVWQSQVGHSHALIWRTQPIRMVRPET